MFCGIGRKKRKTRKRKFSKKKGGKRRRTRKKRKSRKSRKKRRRRTKRRSRKGGWSPGEEERFQELINRFDELWDSHKDVYMLALEQMSVAGVLENQDWERYKVRTVAMNDADIIIPAIASWGITILKVIDNEGPALAADSMPDESQVERLKKAIGEFGSSTMVSLVQHTKEYKQDMQEKKLMAEIRAGKNLKKTKKTP